LVAGSVQWLLVESPNRKVPTKLTAVVTWLKADQVS
jgi:hypothetical protein